MAVKGNEQDDWTIQLDRVNLKKAHNIYMRITHLHTDTDTHMHRIFQAIWLNISNNIIWIGAALQNADDD